MQSLLSKSIIALLLVEDERRGHNLTKPLKADTFEKLKVMVGVTNDKCKENKIQV